MRINSIPNDYTENDNILSDHQENVSYMPLKSILKNQNGILCLAENNQNKEKYIIKQCKITDNDGIPHTVLKEISLLTNIDHKHVITIETIFFTPQHKYICIVYPTVEQTLAQFVKKCKDENQKIKQEIIKKISYQIFAALSHIHRRRMIHGHINLQNILITNTSELHIQIGYFELHNEAINTLSYQSPQLISGSNRTTSKDDVWSAGCVIIKMVTNHLFSGSSKKEILISMFQILPATSNDEYWRKQSEQHSISFENFESITLESTLGELKNNDFACDLLKVKLYYTLYFNTKKKKNNNRFLLFDHQFFMQKILTLDPKKRLTATTSLRHKWFNNISMDNVNQSTHNKMSQSK